MTVQVNIICDFCLFRSTIVYTHVGTAITDLVDNRGWTLMVIKRKTRHRCSLCTMAGRVELA